MIKQLEREREKKNLEALIIALIIYYEERFVFFLQSTNVDLIFLALEMKF